MTVAVAIFALLLSVYLILAAERDRKDFKRQLTETQTENRALVLALTKRQAAATYASSAAMAAGEPVPSVAPEELDRIRNQTLRPGRRFISFGQAKRSLENQETPQRSVNV